MTSRRKIPSSKIRAKPSYFRLKKLETRKTPKKVVTVIKVLSKTDHDEKIPTSLVSLSPDKLVAEKQIDVLVGLFHIMWEDMPRPRTYSIRLADLVSFEGEYVGTALNQGKAEAIDLWRFPEELRARNNLN